MTGNRPLAEDRKVPKCGRCRWPMLPSLYGWVCESPRCMPSRYGKSAHKAETS